MRTSIGLLAVVMLSGCFSPVGEVDGGGSAGGAAGGGATAGGSVAGGSAAGGAAISGGSTAGGNVIAGGPAGGASGGGGAVGRCTTDAQCGVGELCYDCGSFKACAQGCSSSKPCPRGAACLASPAPCVTCPCPQSFCEVPMCVDADGDGFVAGATCGSLPGGDCAPLDPTVHPRALEHCTNGRDDDCNGLVDLRDPECAPTCGPMAPCGSVHDCQLGQSTCSNTCCTSCPVLSPPSCPTTMGLSPPTPDMMTGCPSDVRCVGVGACPFIFAPVCAELGMGDARTFSNSCEAGHAVARIIHVGECLPTEGLLCSPRGPGCAAGAYCRDACPLCDSDIGRRCTKIGACVNDLDCPAGGPPPPPMTCVDGTQAPMRCVMNACVRRCGP